MNLYPERDERDAEKEKLHPDYEGSSTSLGEVDDEACGPDDDYDDGKKAWTPEKESDKDRLMGAIRSLLGGYNALRDKPPEEKKDELAALASKEAQEKRETLNRTDSMWQKVQNRTVRAHTAFDLCGKITSAIHAGRLKKATGYLAEMQRMEAHLVHALRAARRDGSPEAADQAYEGMQLWQDVVSLRLKSEMRINEAISRKAIACLGDKDVMFKILDRMIEDDSHDIAVVMDKTEFTVPMMDVGAEMPEDPYEPVKTIFTTDACTFEFISDINNRAREKVDAYLANDVKVTETVGGMQISGVQPPTPQSDALTIETPTMTFYTSTGNGDYNATEIKTEDLDFAGLVTSVAWHHDSPSVKPDMFWTLTDADNAGAMGAWFKSEIQWDGAVGDAPEKCESVEHLLRKDDDEQLKKRLAEVTDAMKPEGDDAYLKMLEELKEKGVQVPIRTWANAAGYDLDKAIKEMQERTQADVEGNLKFAQTDASRLFTYYQERVLETPTGAMTLSDETASVTIGNLSLGSIPMPVDTGYALCGGVDLDKLKRSACAHEPVDTGMRKSWCRKCDAGMVLNSSNQYVPE